MKLTLQTSKPKKSAKVDGRPSGGSIVRRPGSEDPHRRERKLYTFVCFWYTLSAFLGLVIFVLGLVILEVGAELPGSFWVLGLAFWYFFSSYVKFALAFLMGQGMVGWVWWVGWDSWVGSCLGVFLCLGFLVVMDNPLCFNR